MSITAPAPDRFLSSPTKLFDSYIFDLDGTLYLGENLLPGAASVVDTLRGEGRRVIFCSNNPTRTPQQYARKLGGLGIPAEPDDVITTIRTTVRWLTDNAPGCNVFVIGEDPLKHALAAAGLVLTERPEEIDIVVASYDRSFDYRKLKIAFEAISVYGRAQLISTNPDRFCPLPGGFGDPDAGAVTAAIEASSAVKAIAQLGKPSTHMIEMIAAMTGIDPETTIIVGDRLATDIAMGVAAGMSSALVLTGESTLGDVADADADQRPTFVLDSVDQLVPQLSRQAPS